MSNEILSIVGLMEKMENIAFERFNGNVTDNIYTIYSMLTDIEKITFLKYSYKISVSFLFVMDMVDLDLMRPDRIAADRRNNDRRTDGKNGTIEDADRAELVSMKHRAIIVAGQIVLLMLGLAFVIVLCLTFISPGALKVLKSFGPIIDAILG